MRVKQTIELSITGIAAKGMAIGRTNEGIVVFVFGCIYFFSGEMRFFGG